MKMQKSGTCKQNVLAILVGQFLVLALKGDNKVLSEFRIGYLNHYAKYFGSEGESDAVEDTISAAHAFTDILASRYGWNEDAATLLASKVESVCRDWISGRDAFMAIEQLRTVDLWSGIISCVTANNKIPLSLLDYIVMTLIPVLCHDEIAETTDALIKIMTSQSNPIDVVDKALGKCVKRMCCGIALPKALDNELRLIVLLHMPKDEGLLSSNAGFAYKLLQRQYAKEEVK